MVLGLSSGVRLSLGELACATCSLQAVLLSFLHTRVSREEACLLEEGTIRIVSEEESSGHAVTDSACLTGDTAAANVSYDIELAFCACDAEGLVDDELECFESEVVFYVATVDCDFS